MEEFYLCDSEFRLMDIVWSNAPLESGKLVKLAEENLKWKKSTTYTILRRLASKGMILNEDSVVKVVVGRDRVQRYESTRVVKRDFKGSLPSFLAAFMGDKTLSATEADELTALIDSFREDK